MWTMRSNAVPQFRFSMIHRLRDVLPGATQEKSSVALLDFLVSVKKPDTTVGFLYTLWLFNRAWFL